MIIIRPVRPLNMDNRCFQWTITVVLNLVAYSACTILLAKLSVSTFSLFIMCVPSLASNHSTHTLYSGNCKETRRYRPSKAVPSHNTCRLLPKVQAYLYKVPYTTVLYKRLINLSFIQYKVSYTSWVSQKTDNVS